MSLNFSTDTSTQLTYSSFGFATPQLDNFATSNQLLITSNNLINNINTKQNLLTAATNLLGIGSAITALDYTKITLNKPTDFQANWNTTVINKPSTFPADMTNIYSKTETNNLLSAKEANLTFSAPLTRSTNTIGINLSSYSTTGNDGNYVLRSGSSMTGAIVNSSATASEFKGIYIMHATRQSHLPYIPDGKFYLRAPLVIDNPADFLSFGSRTGDFIIKMFGEDYGFGVNGYTLRYNAAASASHKFYTGSTNTFTINADGNISTLGTITEAGTLLTSRYLKLDGTNTMAANANITLSGTGSFSGIHSGNGAALTNLNYNNIPNRLTFISPLSSNATNQVSIDLSAYSTSSTINTQISNTSNYVSTKFLPLIGGQISGNLIVNGANVGIGITNPFAPLTIGSPAVNSDGFLVIAKNNYGNRNFKIGYDNAFSMCFGDFGNSTVTNTWRSTDFNIRYLDGNIGMGVAASASYKLYVDGISYFNNNLTVNGTCSATTFSGSGANLTNLPLSAYSTTGNDASYLLKTGGVMSGQITGITTLNGTTAIFSTVSTTNNGNANTPQLSAFGGTGDRFILYPGTATVHPYSLGINNGVMWYSVPATSSHIFYVAGSPITTISSTGLSTTGIINASTNLQEGGTNLTSKYAQLGTANTLTGNLTVNANLILKNSVWHQSMDGVYRLYFGLNDVSYYCCGGGLTDGHIFYNSTYATAFKIKNNGDIAATGTISEGGSLLTAKYLQLTGGNITGTLNLLPTTAITPLYIYSTAPASINNIELKNNANNSCYIGIGGTSYTGNYVNNLFLQSPNSLILNTGGTGTGGTPKMIIDSSGCVGIGTATNASYKLNVGGAINAAGNFNSYLGGLRLNGFDTGNTIWQETGNLGISANTGNNILFNIGNGGEKMRIKSNGYVGINNTDPQTHLQVNGLANITNGSPVGHTFMQSGSLTIGGTNANYGCQFYSGGAWSGTNTAGLLLECADNTEIVVHDAGTRLVSMMAYYGGASRVLYIGRAMGWDGGAATPVIIPGNLTINGALDFGSTVRDYIIYLWGTVYGFGVNGGTLRYNSDGVHKFYCGGAESSTFTNKGLVIGTYGTQYYPLIVNKTINGTLSYVYVRTGWNGGSDYNTNSITGDTSASFAGQIHVSGNILNSSDIRIKKEINDINDDGALQQILAIQPKTYKYIDYLSKNNSTVYGFIAQQVKEVIPHAVELVKDIIPNIYKRASCDSNIITLENDVSQELNLNDNIKIYDEFGNDNMYNITEINSNVIKIDKDINTSNIFVFGKEVDDFHTLKKDYIFTLNVCATQELYKLIQNQNIIIEDLKNRILILEQK